MKQERKGNPERQHSGSKTGDNRGEKVPQGGAGSPESEGGSRQGNAGHESPPQGGKGVRQV